MERKDILEAIKEIKKAAKKEDDEVAHGLEDKLMQSFIEYVANRKDSLGQKAKLVLSTERIKFERYSS
uniref:Uncharacterized protein n=1 Tax=viral metagenome TaxID=1070528 RepID=A0A6M3LAR0_9ZZZZ